MCGTPQVETTFSWMAMAATLVTRKRCGLYMASRAKGPRVTMSGVSSVVRCSWANRRSLTKPKGIFLLALEVFITSNLFTWFLVRRKKKFQLLAGTEQPWALVLEAGAPPVLVTGTQQVWCL